MPAKFIVCSPCFAQMTKPRRVGALASRFFFRRRDLLRHFFEDAVDVTLNPNIRDARHAGDTDKRNSFQEQLVDKCPCFGWNSLCGRVLDKLPPARTTKVALFPVVNLTVPHDGRSVALWTVWHLSSLPLGLQRRHSTSSLQIGHYQRIDTFLFQRDVLSFPLTKARQRTFSREQRSYLFC